jgi:2,4-dienoyl-CoA reductase-like NADH-dependent reductase (Old Yellow Enzyme family)
MKFSELLSPIKIGSTEVKNRFIVPAALSLPRDIK